VWQDVEREYFELDIGLFFMNALPLQEVKGYLEARRKRLIITLEHIRSHREEQLEDANVPRLAAAIFDHTIAHTQAELAWTEELVRKIENGEYP
jgi:hypothetical protein